MKVFLWEECFAHPQPEASRHVDCESITPATIVTGYGVRNVSRVHTLLEICIFVHYECNKHYHLTGMHSEAGYRIVR